MHSSSGNAAGCPDGYCRYVYRVKVSIPLENQFRQKEPPPQHPDRARESHLEQALGTKVRLRRRGRGGHLIVYFSSDERLESICDHIIGTPGGHFKSQFRQKEPPPQHLDRVRESHLEQALDTKVRLRRRGKSGHLTIYFRSEGQLQSICNRIIGE